MQLWWQVDTKPLPFNESLTMANITEQEVMNILINAGAWVRGKCHDSRCDLHVILNDWGFLIEIKDESAFNKSGNICIEAYQGNPPNPSGIYSTDASHFIHVIGTKAVIYKTQPMRLWLRKFKIKPRNFKNSDNHNGGYLVEISRLANWSEWFDHCDIGELPNSHILGG